MKTTLFSSIALSVLFCSGQAMGDLIPESPEQIRTCHEVWAESYRGTPNHIPALTYCDKLKKCTAHHTINQQEYLECSADAKVQFLAATDPNRQPKADDEYGTSSPIVTNVADSDYERRDNKGWKESDLE